MSSEVLTFHLCPDRAAARRLRRVLAEGGVGFNVAVGTWTDLLERTRQAYLVPAHRQDWAERVRTALTVPPEPFWAKSFAVAPVETATTVRAALEAVLAGTGPGARPDPARVSDLRTRRRLTDLMDLWDAMGQSLPPDLETISAVLRAPAPVRPLAVSCPPDLRLTPWARALLDRLARDARTKVPEPITTPLDQGPACPATALGHLGDWIFAPDPPPPRALDDTVQWIGVRDLEDASAIAAGMAQTVLDREGWSPADIGLLVPDDPAAWEALESAFIQAGLPLSHLGRHVGLRDLGREAVEAFARCQQAPAPSVALASLVTSPLMPWPRATGTALARAVMNGRRPRLDETEPEDWRSLLASFTARAPTSSHKLAGRLRLFLTALERGRSLKVHRRRAREAVEQAGALLIGHEGTAIPWDALFRALEPGDLSHAMEAEPWREGITVLNAAHLPWRAVRHLIVVGFNAGQWPIPPGTSPVFSGPDLIVLRDAGLDIDTPDAVLADRRALFRSQIRAASERASFIVARRDGFGDPLEPSETLVFMHRLLGRGVDDAEGLILDLDAPEERDRVLGLALAAPLPVVPPRPLDPGSMAFDRDLTRLGGRDGGPITFSPSRLETLVVSPLAWMLQHLGAEPTAWAPEDLDVVMRGTIAHSVFERVFPPTSGKGTLAAMPLDAAFDNAVAREAPFLDRPDWAVERRALKTDIEAAAKVWEDILTILDAEVIATECRLSGHLREGGVPLRGYADAILRRSDGTLLIVDYKKSSSRQRRVRMEKGWDHQASLYRVMLRSGDAETLAGLGLTKPPPLESVGVLYFTMNDGRALCDRTDGLPAGQSRLHGMENDVAEAIMARIRDRLAALRAGTVALFHPEDATWLERNAGITAYAREVSPLIDLFPRPDDDRAEEGA
jgi:hypothetical protein